MSSASVSPCKTTTTLGDTSWGLFFVHVYRADNGVIYVVLDAVLWVAYSF